MFETIALATVLHAACVPQRDAAGRIARSRAVVSEFRRGNPCPVTGAVSGACTGYVVDHVVPLKRCGPDSPENLQWQTREDARIKDRLE